MPQAFYCKDRQQLNLKHTSIKLFQQLSKPRISNRNSTDKASWGSTREFQTEILQTKQVGVRGPNRNSTERNSNRNSTDKLGFGVCLDNALITYAPLKPFIKIQSVNKINVYSFIYITHLSL